MIRAAAILAVSFVVVTSSQPPPPAPTKAAEKQEKQTPPEKRETKAKQEAPSKAPPTPGPVDQTRAEVARREQKQPGAPSNDKSSAEWWSKLNAGLVTLFTGVLALLAYFQWQATQKQAGYMRDAMSATNKAADAAMSSAETAKLMERPWVTASLSARRELTFLYSGDAMFMFMLMLKNVGASAATDVRYAVDMFALGDDYLKVLSERHAAISTNQWIGPGFSLFPGEETSISLIRNVERADVEKEAWTDGHDDKPVVVLCVAGIVTYRFATSSREHTTRFAYYVAEDEPDMDRSIVYVGQDLHPEDMVFPKEHRASYAD